MIPAGITEQLEDGPIPRWTNPDWQQRFPWLVQGTTGQGDAEDPYDLGLSGAAAVGGVLERWRALGRATGMP
ncbi:MAG TPA: hypothetical protein VGR27_07455, partial [Longimicrobiaceae bacterium]|nr:hypothetical protein [Longimicrobiaceae bacterium]